MKKRSKLEKFTPFVVGACMLTFVAACGSDDDDSSSGVPQQQSEQQQEGQYRVVMTPVNPNVAGDITGEGEFTIEGDDFQAKLNVNGAPAAIHRQHIHTGGACATSANDTNGDGYVDAVEASAVSGAPFLPLDSDLRAQAAGGTYPSGANYKYNESTSFQTMLADLRLPDTDSTDSLVKLGADEELNLEGRVVVIHGLPSSTTLPATVSGIDDLSPQQSLPIACGIITRVADTTTGTTTDGTTTGGTDTGSTGTTTGTTGTTSGTTGSTTGTTGTTGSTTGTTGTTGSTTGTTGTTGSTTGTTGTTTGTTGTGTTTGTTM